jgi:hypothetical protein
MQGMDRYGLRNPYEPAVKRNLTPKGSELVAEESSFTAINPGDIIKSPYSQVTFLGIRDGVIKIRMDRSTFLGQNHQKRNEGRIGDYDTNQGKFISLLKGSMDDPQPVLLLAPGSTLSIEDADTKKELVILSGSTERDRDTNAWPATTTYKAALKNIMGDDEQQPEKIDPDKKQTANGKAPDAPKIDPFAKGLTPGLPRDEVKELSEMEQQTHAEGLGNPFLMGNNAAIANWEEIENKFKSAGSILQSFDEDENNELSTAEINKAVKAGKWSDLAKALDAISVDGVIDKQELAGALAKLPEEFKIADEKYLLAQLNAPMAKAREALSSLDIGVADSTGLVRYDQNPSIKKIMKSACEKCRA